jgi:MFS transporter, BCD family, chlorophyll transporter
MSAVADRWTRVGVKFLPFADAASAELPLARLLRLSLFQVSCGMTAVLLTGTLNRVMIVEMGIPAGVVALLVALPLLFAPARALIGFKSDHHKSFLGWKRVPYLWFGTMLQFGGLAIMPFAMLIMTGGGNAPVIVGEIFCALAFLLVGAGLHTTQTAGLALATDLAPEDTRPRVVALLYVMLLVGTLLSALLVGQLLVNFSPTRLVAVVQGAAVVTIVLNVIALWKQEPRRPSETAHAQEVPDFGKVWRLFLADRRTRRMLVAVGLGAAGFSMQDVLLEPYGAEVLGMGVGETTRLTAVWAAGTLLALAVSSGMLGRGTDPLRVAAMGLLSGIAAFAAVVISAPTDLPLLLGLGVAGIGFGGGLFGVGTLTAAMAIGRTDGSDPAKGAGLALGVFGAVQATAAGVGIILSGLIRDGLSAAAAAGALGPALSEVSMPYSVVWHIEIGLLFATLVALGPLVRRSIHSQDGAARPFGLQEFPA